MSLQTGLRSNGGAVPEKFDFPTQDDEYAPHLPGKIRVNLEDILVLQIALFNVFSSLLILKVLYVLDTNYLMFG